MKISYMCCLLVSILIIGSCKKREDQSAPHLTTITPNAITSTTARSGGTGIDNGPIIEKGVCFSNSRIPDINDSKSSNGGGDGSYSTILTDLEPNMTYYVRAYATNKYRTGYGPLLKFTTSNPPPLPTLLTNSPFSLTKNSVSVSAVIQSITSTSITSMGFCWSKNSKPTVKDNVKTLPVTSTGTTFTASLQNLDANTIYYVRAYAVNADGTSYSNEVSLTTFYSAVTDINGNVYNTIIIGGKEWMAENLRVDRFNDGTTISKISNDATWSNAIAPAFCIFNNSSLTPLVYGKLYNWYCVSSNRNLAPQGWHVSTLTDWSDLIYALGTNVGNKLRLTGNTYWNYSYGTNESGFSAIGAGLRTYYGSYESQLSIAQFWQKGSSSSSIYLDYSGAAPYNNSMSETTGLSIRCVKD